MFVATLDARDGGNLGGRTVKNKHTYGRRDFLALAGAAVAGLAGAAWPRGLSGGSGADLVVFNANVRTVDPGMLRAEAFAVKNGRFVAVGSSDDIKRAFGQGARMVDAERMTILPGFIDCHNHAEGETLLYEVLVGNPFEVEFVAIDGIVEKLRQKAAQTPEGTWVEGFFFDDTKVKDKRQLNVHDLDRVSTGTPSRSIIAAGIRPSTIASRCVSPASRRTRPIRPAAPSTMTRPGN